MQTLTVDKIAVLQNLLVEQMTKQNYESARQIQSEIVQLAERDQTSTTQDLGDSHFLLGQLTYRVAGCESAMPSLIKALGFRRLYYGKGHQKVVEVMELIREIRNTKPTVPSKIDLRRKEFRHLKARN